VGGSCCPEIDLLEANRHGLQITMHKCTSPASGCDSGGCAINTQSISSTAYGPSSSYHINTANPFTVKTTFTTSGGSLTTVTSVISQGSNSLTLTHSSTTSGTTSTSITTNCGSGYLSSVGSSLSLGVVPVFSYWSGSVTWLDSPACSSETNEESGSQEIISGITITGASAVAPPPPPPPANPPGTLSCGTSTGTNINWVEFLPPGGVCPSSSPGTATVDCSGANPLTDCTWYAAGCKFQCSAPGAGCTSPLPYYNGSPCPFPGEAATMADASALSNDGSLSVPVIAGVAGGCVVVVVLIVIVIVVVLKKKKTEEYV